MFLQATIIIESIIRNQAIMPLFEIHEKDFCKAMNKYLGEFWYGIERAAQLPVGVCPIRAVSLYKLFLCNITLNSVLGPLPCTSVLYGF